MKRKRIMMLAMVLLGVAAIAGASAISVSAQSHEFIASKTGKTKSKGVGAQIIRFNGQAIECTEASGTGEVTATSSATHKEAITFGGCTGFGGEVTISTADFEFNANGKAKLENSVTITVSGADCEVIAEPQTDESLTYSTSGSDLKSVAKIKGIALEGTGGECGGNKEASYAGTMEAELEGGTLSWK